MRERKGFQSESMDRRFSDGASVLAAPRTARCDRQTPTKPTSILEGETGSRLEFRSGGEAYPLRRSQGDGDDDAEVVVAYDRSGSTRIFHQNFRQPPINPTIFRAMYVNFLPSIFNDRLIEEERMLFSISKKRINIVERALYYFFN